MQNIAKRTSFPCRTFLRVSYTNVSVCNKNQMVTYANSIFFAIYESDNIL